MLSWAVWLYALGFVLGQLLILFPPFQKLITATQRWLLFDTIHLITMATVVFFVIVAFAWYHLLENILLIAAAEILARLDLKNVGSSWSQVVAILSSILVTGMMVGWLAHTLTSPEPTAFISQ